MGRYTQATCRLCRREQEKLFLKGSKCSSDKCTLAKRSYAPGQHGSAKTRTKLSNYGLQLREKQKVKRTYGMMENQFRRYFDIATKTKGITGRLLLQLLERRLDNVVFRMGVGLSRAQARQFVRHNLVWVNEHRVNIPSYLIKKDDVIYAKAKEKTVNKFRENLELAKDRGVPAWLEFDPKELKAKVLRLPEKEDMLSTIEEQLIVELYSK